MTTVVKTKRGSQVLLLVVAMLVLAVLACGGGDEPEATEEPATEEEVAEVETPTEEEPAGGSLDVVNESGDAICFVYISLAGSGDWGDDWLGAENVIEAGGTHTINNIPPGAYDIRVDDCNNETIYEQDGAKLGATDFTLTVTGAAETADEGEGSQLILENTSGIEICYLYIALPSDESWGNNQLDEGDTVPPGKTYTIWGIPPGTYDLRVETCQSDPNSRQSAERAGVDLTRDFTWTIEPSEEGAKLVLVNKSGALLCYLYIALPSDETWGNNQLPEGTQVRTGTNFTITGIPPGTYDLRVETCESDPNMRVYLEAYDANIQTEFTWTINP